MVLLYTVFLLTFVNSVENMIFLFSSYLRENTMCEGVKVLKNKNMSLLFPKKTISQTVLVWMSLLLFTPSYEVSNFESDILRTHKA